MKSSHHESLRGIRPSLRCALRQVNNPEDRRYDSRSMIFDVIACCAPLAAPTVSDAEAQGDREHLPGARRPGAREDREPPRDERRARLRLRAVRAARPRAAHGLPPPEEADRCRSARPRAARQVGLLLVEPRGRRDARGRRRPERSVLLMSTTADELREEVRRRYAESAAPSPRIRRCGCGSGSCCSDDRARARSRARSSARCSTTPSSAASCPSGGAGVARLRQPDRGRRAARGRDRARPRLGRRHRRDPVGKRVGPTGTAYGLDMTDEMLALAQRNARRGGRRERPLPEGRDRGDPAPGGERRRRDLELRHQPLDRQGGGADRDRARAPAGRADRRSATSSPRTASAPTERAERGSYVGCIAGALSKSEYDAGLEAAGFEDVSVEFTHEVADGMHGAIVKARKTTRAGGEGAAGDPACCEGWVLLS